MNSNLRKLITLLAAATAVLAFASSANAATSQFLRADGFAGESVAAGMTGAMDVDSFKWSVESATSYTSGGGASVGKPQPGELTIDKKVDATSPLFLQRQVQGLSIPALDLVIRKAGSNAVYLRYCFVGAFVTGYEHKGSDEAATETLKFVYKEVAETYTKFNAAGATTGTVFAGWNIATGTLMPTPGTLPAVCTKAL